MYAPLQKEGLTELEFLAVTDYGLSWEDHVSGYGEVDYPVMADTSGVFYLYGTKPYDVVLIDKKARLVTKEAAFAPATYPSKIEPVKTRLRELYEE